MSSISPNMIRNICSVKTVTDMFIDFDKNSSYFDEGSMEEYLSSIKKFIEETLQSHIDSSSFIMEKDMISSVTRLYKTYFCTSEERVLKERIFSLLRDYKNVIDICVVRRDGPCSLENKDLRNKALEVADSQIKEISAFLESVDYSNIFFKRLSAFDEYLESDKEMSKKDFNAFTELLSKAGVVFPVEYANTYFKQLIVHRKGANYLAIKSSILSMIKAFSASKGVDCLLEIGDTDFLTSGIYYNGIITISLNEFDYFVSNPVTQAQSFFETIFHEFRHLVQDANYKKVRKFSYNEIKMLKDDLLFASLSSRFGKDNYANLSYELDAREMSRVYAERYLRFLGVPTRDARERNKIDRLRNKTDKRFVDYKMVSVDQLFDDLFSSVQNIMASDYLIDVFREYPIIGLLYDENGKRRTSLELFRLRSEAERELAVAKPESREELEIRIHNINEVLYNQDLSFVNLIADFKELLNDTSLDIDSDEKIKYMQMLHDKANAKDQRSFKDLSFFVGKVLKRKQRDIVTAVESTLATGKEMLGIFNEIFDKMVAENKQNPRLVNKKSQKTGKD